MDDVSNEEVDKNFGMSKRAVGIECGVVERVKRNTMRWYGHVRRMPEERMAKKVYQSEVSGVVGRGRPAMSWERKVEQYLKDRIGSGVETMERAKVACNDRVSWRLFCHGHHSSWELPGARRRR